MSLCNSRGWGNNSLDPSIMEKSFIILYGWKEPWGKLQKVLLKEDEEIEKLLPNKYDISEIDEGGKIVFDVDRLGLEWDCFGIVLRNDPLHESTTPTIDSMENIISRKTFDDLDRRLIGYLRDKPDLLGVLSGEPKLYIWKNP